MQLHHASGPFRNYFPPSRRRGCCGGAAPFPPNPRLLSPAAGERGVLPWDLSMSCSRKGALESSPFARGVFAVFSTGSCGHETRTLGIRWNDVSTRRHIHRGQRLDVQPHRRWQAVPCPAKLGSPEQRVPDDVPLTAPSLPCQKQCCRFMSGVNRPLIRRMIS